ncbi:uncharacterized protein LOC126707190 isoform X1 [Quercus robur]|uniref:uncharacterized protein LOC126707190 isoform X1 n=1 Tax=Quercus robur TaxID=38942 RepID=UPI002163724D|nr:uncharacterized protein LOC126707190 isoform X1 [Quercus robur]
MEGKGKGLAMQFEIALFASTSATRDGIQAEWYTIKVPDPECIFLHSVTTVEKPLRPFSKVWLACAYREHAVIGSRLYSLGGMNPDSEPFAGVTTPEFARFLKVRSFDLSTPDDGWKPVATMTFPKRFEPPCLVLDDKLYVLGSVSASEVEAKGYGWMEVYDPDSNTWEPLPNPPLGFSLSARSLAYYATLDSKKQILVAQHDPAYYATLDSKKQILDEDASLFATFYVYHVIDRCWTLLEPPKRKLRPYYHDPVRGRRSTIVDNTIYWGFVLDGIVRVQSHDIDTDLYFHGRLDIKRFFEDGEFAVENCPKLPLLHVADQTFCLLMFTFVAKMEEEDSGEDSDIELFEDNGIIFLNCIVLDISLNLFKDEGKQQSKEEFDEIYKYHFMGDSSKQLNISLVSVQKYPVRNGSFWLNDAVLLDCPTYMPMKKTPKLSHETSVMIKDNLRL